MWLTDTQHTCSQAGDLHISVELCEDAPFWLSSQRGRFCKGKKNIGTQKSLNHNEQSFNLGKNKYIKP